MAPSYRSIDYRLRPSKHAERLMLCESFRRIRFHPLEEYQYVGLGSVYFFDFRLIHRTLGITRMFSIEKQIGDKDRFEWNKPYAGIKMLFGSTEDRLSDIDLSRPTIAWLDYDGPLNGSVLNDIRTVAHSAFHGTFLIVTVNAQPKKSGDSATDDLLDRIREELGASRIPAAATSSSLRGWGLADLYRRVIDGEIRDALSNADGAHPETESRDYEQLFHYRYEDGARMATVGGVFFESNRRDQFDACAFERLEFIKQGSEAFRISAPKLTFREIAHLERQLPLQADASLDPGPVSQALADEYGRLYRYLPAYLPVEVF